MVKFIRNTINNLSNKKNNYISECRYRKKIVKKRLKDLEKCGTDSTLKEFYAKKEKYIEHNLLQYEIALKNWAIIIFHYFHKYTTANEEALKCAVSLKDENGYITLPNDVIIQTTSNCDLYAHLREEEQLQASPFFKFFVFYYNQYVLIKNEYEALLKERNC